MPGWEETESEIRFRIREPDLFEEGVGGQKEISDGVRLVFGKFKKSGKWDIRAVRFDKPKWTLERAKAWFKEHFPDEYRMGMALL